MSGTQVQSNVSFNNTGTTTQAITFTSTATSGNLLQLMIAYDKNVTAINTPSGWTLIGSTYVSASVSGAWFYKVSDGTETGVTVTTTVGTDWNSLFTEYSGIDTLDVNAQANSGATAVTSQTSGTTGTTANSDSHAFVFFGSDSKGNTDAGGAFTNSFTSIYTDPGTIGTGNAGCYCAELVLASTGTQTSTYSTSGGGDQMFGMVAVFYLAGGAPAGNSYYYMGNQ